MRCSSTDATFNSLYWKEQRTNHYTLFFISIRENPVEAQYAKRNFVFNLKLCLGIFETFVNFDYFHFHWVFPGSSTPEQNANFSYCIQKCWYKNIFFFFVFRHAEIWMMNFVSFKLCLALCLFFFKFHLKYAYKRYAYKNICMSTNSINAKSSVIKYNAKIAWIHFTALGQIISIRDHLIPKPFHINFREKNHIIFYTKPFFFYKISNIPQLNCLCEVQRLKSPFLVQA